MASSALGAVLARFNESALADTFSASGKAWLDEVPEEKTTLPFAAVFHRGDSDPDNTTEAEFTRNTTAHLELYHTDLDDLGTYARSAETLYNLASTNESAAAFTVTSAKVLASVIGVTQFFNTGKRTRTDQKVYGARINITLWVRYSR